MIISLWLFHPLLQLHFMVQLFLGILSYVFFNKDIFENEH